jgi:hypothetical protein
MDEQTQRTWCRPELIVLVRGGPEEAVLGGCKLNLVPGDPSSVNYGCAAKNVECDNYCTTITSS